MPGSLATLDNPCDSELILDCNCMPFLLCCILITIDSFVFKLMEHSPVCLQEQGPCSHAL